MNISEYSRTIKSIMDQEGGCVVLLKGPWGVGKTFFWTQFASKELEEKQHAYVSLFGKSDIKSIELDALSQVFTRNRYISWVTDTVKDIKGTIKEKLGQDDFNIGMTGASVGMILSLFKVNSLNNHVVCIDDFERKSKSLDISEIMGFASILSERYACKVVIIMDEEKIPKDSLDKYNEYKEKMVNYEVEFDPENSELIDSLLGSLDPKYRDGVLSAVTFAGEKNLRVIKKIVNRLNFFTTIIEEEVSDDFCKKIGFDISLLMIVYCALGAGGLVEITHTGENDQNKEQQLGKERFEKIVDCRRKVQARISSYSELDQILWKFIHTLTLKQDEVKIVIAKEEQKIKYTSIKDSATAAMDKYAFDLKYTPESYVKDLMGIVSDNKNEILSILNFDTFLLIMKSLEHTSANVQDVVSLRDEILEKYAINKALSIEAFDDYKKIKSNGIIDYICSTSPSIQSKYSVELKRKFNAFVHHKEVSIILDALIHTNGWSAEEENMLNSLQAPWIKASIEESHVFFENLVSFIVLRKTSSSFKPFIDAAISAINLMKQSELDKFRFELVSRHLGSL